MAMHVVKGGVNWHSGKIAASLSVRVISFYSQLIKKYYHAHGNYRNVDFDIMHNYIYYGILWY